MQAGNGLPACLLFKPPAPIAPPAHAEMPRHLAAARVSPALRDWVSRNIPATALKLEVYRLSNHFREVGCRTMPAVRLLRLLCLLWLLL